MVSFNFVLQFSGKSAILPIAFKRMSFSKKVLVSFVSVSTKSSINAFTSNFGLFQFSDEKRKALNTALRFLYILPMLPERQSHHSGDRRYVTFRSLLPTFRCHP